MPRPLRASRPPDRESTPPSRARFDGALSAGELVRRARGGDRWATEALFRRHVEPMTRLATRLMARRCDADDAVQDAFAEAFLGLEKLREPEAFRSWLGRILVTRCRRKLSRRRWVRLVGLDAHVDDSSLEQMACGAASPEVLAELRIVDAVLRELPADVRIAWVLRHVQEETLSSVAALAGCSVATAKRRIQAAEVMLAGRLRRDER